MFFIFSHITYRLSDYIGDYIHMKMVDWYSTFTPNSLQLTLLYYRLQKVKHPIPWLPSSCSSRCNWMRTWMCQSNSDACDLEGKSKAAVRHRPSFCGFPTVKKGCEFQSFLKQYPNIQLLIFVLGGVETQGTYLSNLQASCTSKYIFLEPVLTITWTGRRAGLWGA